MPASQARSKKLYIGPRLRRLRRDLGQTQAEMAEALGVSASYVNLVERNQRPLSAALLLRIAEAYSVDLSALAAGDGADLFADLEAAFADPIFEASGVTRADLQELAAGNPVLGEAVARLYRAWRGASAELADAQAGGKLSMSDPVEEVRDFIARARNHFPEIDALAEATAGEIGLPKEDAVAAISERFRAVHGLSVRVLPADVMEGAFRRYNRHGRYVAVSEALDHASRAFQLALQLVLIERRGALDAAVNAERFSGDAARRLARATVANYAAAALLMPYGHFLKSAESLAYDVEALGRRYRASFEQIAHRLATLQRPGVEGVPFFFLRVDAAGNVSKRFSAGVFPFAKYGGSCPLWNVHEAFRAPYRVLTQTVQLPDGATYFSIARTVRSGDAGYDRPRAERAVALGCDISYADRLVYARDLDPARAAPTPIGVTCRLCERTACAARAHPPLRRRLVVDETRRMATPFSFAFD